jgi:hypothetical protein
MFGESIDKIREECITDIDIVVDCVVRDDPDGINQIITSCGNNLTAYNPGDLPMRNDLESRIKFMIKCCSHQTHLSSLERFLLMNGYFSLVLKMRQSNGTKHVSATIPESLLSIWIYYSSSRDYYFERSMSLIPQRCETSGINMSELVERIDFRKPEDDLVVNTQALFELLVDDVFKILNAGKVHNFRYDGLEKECQNMLDDIYVTVIEQLIASKKEAYAVPLFDRLFNSHLEIPSGQLLLSPQIQNSRVAIDILLDILDAKRKREVIPELQSRYKQMCERKGIYKNISGRCDGRESLYVTTHGIDLDELCRYFSKNLVNYAQAYLQARLMNMRRDEILIPINECEETAAYGVMKLFCLMVIMMIELSYNLPSHNYYIRLGLFCLWMVFDVYRYIARWITFPSECHKLDTGITPHRKLFDSVDILYGIIILTNWIIYEVIGGSAVSLARRAMILQVICAICVNLYGRVLTPWRYRTFTVTQ